MKIMVVILDRRVTGPEAAALCRINVSVYFFAATWGLNATRFEDSVVQDWAVSTQSAPTDGLRVRGQAAFAGT